MVQALPPARMTAPSCKRLRLDPHECPVVRHSDSLRRPRGRLNGWPDGEPCVRKGQAGARKNQRRVLLGGWPLVVPVLARGNIHSPFGELVGIAVAACPFRLLCLDHAAVDAGHRIRVARNSSQGWRDRRHRQRSSSATSSGNRLLPLSLRCAWRNAGSNRAAVPSLK